MSRFAPIAGTHLVERTYTPAKADPLPKNLPPAAAVLFGARLVLLDGLGSGIVGHEDERDDRLGLDL